MVKIKNPRTTIIIATYNGEKYIERAIESALGQTDEDFEIIVVDDASTDRTKKILLRYQNKVKLIFHKKNRKVSTALNSALKIARGRYIVRLDDDDYLAPNLVEKEANFLDKKQKIDFLYCDYYLVNESEKIIEAIELPEYSPNVVHHYYLVAVGTMIRKSVFEKIGLFDEKIYHQEMYDLFIRIQKAKLNGAHFKEKLFYYTRRPGQVTQDSEKLKQFTELVRKKHNLSKNEVVVKW